MRIKMDTTTVRFMVTRPVEPKVDRESGQQRVDRSTGALLWQTQVMALDESGGEILTITLDSETSVTVGEDVQLAGLVAIPWSQGERSGVAFRAGGMTSTAAAKRGSSATAA